MKHVARKIRFENTLKPNLQYTYVTTIGNAVYTRSRTPDGTPVYTEEKLTPCYYLPCDPGIASHKGYDGTPLIEHMCDTIKEAKEFIQQNPEAFGDIGTEYMLLYNTYGPNEVAFDMDHLYIWNIDIEVQKDKDRGFAPIDDPFNPITAITVLWRHLGKSGKIVYGTKDYTPVRGELYVKCEDELDLLRKFMTDYRAGGDYPDIITGWNVQFFDIPYLVNRCRRLFSEDLVSRLSPFNRMADRTVILDGREQKVIELRGVVILDYYELYRKFTLVKRENYKLNTIAYVELGKKKMSFEEFRRLERLYEEDPQKFYEYNLTDVELVDELDQKLKLIELVCALTYNAKVNMTDCFKQVRLWDIMIYHKLRSLDLQIPPRRQGAKTEQYAGAYVKDPIVGMHPWVVSFDVASMYPHIMREWNLSPEMLCMDENKDLIEQLPATNDLLVEAMLKREVNLTDELKRRNVALAGNGVFTRRDKEGFLPAMLKLLYDERNRFKKLMKQEKAAAEKATDPAEKAKHKKLQAAYNNQQAVRKVNLNSAYGACGSPYFRYYDVALAEAVTITGQLAIRWIANDLNAYLNKHFHTNIDYVIASDTDSVYLKLGIVAEYYQKQKPGATTQEIVDMFDKFCEAKMMPIINKSFEDLATYLNVYVPCLSMVRDVIADKGVWTAKKRYILNVYNSEGQPYNPPDLKMMGIEAIKSSTPEIVRKMIVHTLKLLMTGTQEEVWTYIAQCQEEFRAQKFEAIAFPRGINEMAKYEGQDKSVPIHVRAAQVFNRKLESSGITFIEPIQSGDKIRFAYLKEPNPFFSNVIGAPSGCPEEWQVEKWIDWDTQFEKTFISPIETILTAAGWTVEKQNALW